MKIFLDKSLVKYAKYNFDKKIKMVFLFSINIILLFLAGVFATAGLFLHLNIFYIIGCLLFSSIIVYISIALQKILIGMAICKVSNKNDNQNYYFYANAFLLSNDNLFDNKKNTMVTDFALQYLVQQLRIYANEKNFQQTKLKNNIIRNNVIDGETLLKRRWDDVLDTVNEYEIYLANNPVSLIENIVSKSSTQFLDVSQIFREVADTFDNTWRKKGINIETAIVNPLKATTSEHLLRRILVGPWRTSVLLSRRGNGVIFSAKSVDSVVTARWEIDGLTIPESYFAILTDFSLSVNERIQKGMDLIAYDSTSSNVFLALMSFVIWVELIIKTNISYKYKNSNEGFVIEIYLK